uniref:Uncharacterized protein n=1 Tax=Loxodonta africana TaxID=9785 RepID=G3TWA1_LOXAF
ILRVYNHGGQALSLNAGELALLGLTGDAILIYHCKTLQGGCKMLLIWLLLAWCQCWESSLHFEAIEMPFWPWTSMKDGIQLVCKLDMLDSSLRDPAPWRPAPKVVPFTQGLQWWLLTAKPSDLWLSLVSLLVKGMKVLEAMTEIQIIADVVLFGCGSQPCYPQLMLGPNPTLKDLMGWLLGHCMPKMEKQPTKVLVKLNTGEAR